MEEIKIWSLEEANRLLPTLDPLVSRVREAAESYRFAMEQIGDLQRMHGPVAVREPEHETHAEFMELVREAAIARGRLEDSLRELAEFGVEMKDPLLGLLDFPTMRGPEVVYLCWRQGEPEIRHWHTRTSGFAGRRPVDELVRAGGR